jgi:hypothetical protein
MDMLRLLLLLSELTLLFFISRWLTQSVFALCLLLFRARPVAVTIITILNYPGTVVHELSHLFTAEVLGVRTGKLTLVPESIQEDEVKAGSVMIAATDPFRLYLIGLAPIVTGLLTLTVLSYALFQYVPYWGDPPAGEAGWAIWGYVGGVYLLLAVSNAMFSSTEDLKGFIPFIITLAILAVAAYFAGFRVGITGPALNVATQILDALTKSLGIVLAVNIAGIILTNLLIILTEKLTRRKLLR